MRVLQAKAQAHVAALPVPLLQVPLAVLAPAETDGTVRRDEGLALLVENDRLPFRIVRFTQRAVEIGRAQFARNVTITGGVAPVRAYIDRLLPGILDGTVPAGRVFDVELPLDEAATGYELMDRREALKVMLRP